MNPDIKIALCILEYILQKKIYRSSRYVHVEGVAKCSLDRQLEHLVSIRNKLEPHIQERLDIIVAANKKLKPASKFEMKKKTAKVRYHPLTKQNTLGSRQHALMKAIADVLASDKAEAYEYISLLKLSSGGSSSMHIYRLFLVLDMVCLPMPCMSLILPLMQSTSLPLVGLIFCTAWVNTRDCFLM